MKYILLSAENTVMEIIPGEDPVFPGIPLEKRYSADFIARLMPIDDAVEVYQNWTYDAESGSFAAPVIEESIAPEDDTTYSELAELYANGVQDA